MSTDMLLGHIALGVYSLALTAGIFVLLSVKVDVFHRFSLFLLMTIEIIGAACLIYHMLVG